MVKYLKHIIIAVCLLAAMPLAMAEDTMTGIFNERIRTLNVSLEGYDQSQPIIVLDTPDRLIFSFDHLAEEHEYLRYELVHCNSDWQPSGLVDSEFLDGFNLGNIDTYAYAQATTVHYIHYELAIPNVEVAPKISGNYLLKVYPESDPDDVWLQCRFYVTEQSAPVEASVTSRTDVDYNKQHQQLSVVVDTERAGVPDPFNEVKVVIQQNGRYDNQAVLQQPLRMANRNTLVYEHQKPLIFEAGNEYRRMETVSVIYPSMGVEYVEYYDPYYHMLLYPDESRAESPYLYDQTQFGRFKIRGYNSLDSDVEADYIVTHFVLDIPEIEGCDIFLDGDFTQRRFNPESLMVYNRSEKRYERNMLLKQGAYNYQYLVVPRGENRGYTSYVEGDNYQTVNEYLIKVYTRHPGDRYDRLIGVTTIYSGI